MVAFLLGWVALSFFVGALWALAGSRGGIIAPAGYAPVRYVPVGYVPAGVTPS